MSDYKAHWEKVYATKTPEEVSWTQIHPVSSLKLIQDAANSKESSFIDIGGGDSVLADCLLVDGFTDITVLDISKHALDRAVFHFLTDAAEIQNYANLVAKFVKGDMIIATFSTEGPKRCSGLDVKQYDVKSLQLIFASAFDLVESFTEDHITPFDTKQNFLFARFKRRQSVR